MLTFIARTFLLLAAAFGLGAIGGRLSRKSVKGRSPSAERPAPPAADLHDASQKPHTGLSAEHGPAATEAGSARPPEAFPTDATLGGLPDPLAPAGETAPAVVASYGGSSVAATAERVGVGAGGAAPHTIDELETTSAGHAALPASNERPPAQTAGGVLHPASEGDLGPGWEVPPEPMAERNDPAEIPAAFKSSGSAAPLQGAPDDREGETSEASAPSSVSNEAVADRSTPVDAAEADIARPAALAAPRGGTPDDLTRIFGIGPSIERLLFENGIFHYDQIAAWSLSEARWADGLSGFQGRAEREAWVDQAAALATETATP